MRQTSRVVVRRAEPADALAVARVHVRSWQAGYRGLMPDDYLDGLRPEDRAATYNFGTGDAGAPVTLVDEEADGGIVGFVTLGCAPDASLPEAGTVFALYVDPPHWRAGVGRRLIASAREQLVTWNCPQALLWVLRGNERAERFYAADGWTPDGRQREAEVWGITVDEHRYQRALP